VEGLRAGDPLRVGQYRLVGRLGGGGMGTVFLGRSPGGRLVAVKVIRADLAEGADFRARFGREVAVARKVSGLFTALVVDADTEGPVPWLATAYVPGPSLTEAVTAHGPLPTDTVLTLAGGLAEGLADVHATGIVHRDLKPSNVLLAHDGPRLIDFGISRAVESSALTHTGQIVGSPGFMSPEQAEGHEVGPPSDIFSLGAVLVFAATGVGPFGTGSTAALVYRVVHAQPDLDRVPAEIRPLVEQCLAKDPVQRPAPGAILAGLADAQPGADPVRWLPSSILQDFTEPAPTDESVPGGRAVQASPTPSGPAFVTGSDGPGVSAPVGPDSDPARSADPAVAGVPSTATTARPHQAPVVPAHWAPQNPEGQAAPASAAPGRAPFLAASAAIRVPSAAARGASAKQRSRRRSRVVAVTAVAALLGIAAGTVIWAQWARHSAGAAPAQPTRLTAGPATDTSVAISWSAPSSGPLPSRYLILRNGSVIGSVAGTTTSYRATGLAPGISYSYQVLAVRGGSRSPRSSPIMVTTATPPVSAAVLAGADTVHYKDVRTYGLASKLSLRTDTWSFRPKCATGTCSVDLAGAVGGSQFTAILHRSGAVYRGKTTLKNGVVCGSVSSESSLTIQIAVRTGRPADGQWLAASWAGRLILYSPSTAKCFASGIKASIYGNS
jgi:serine/threonine protein kinase